MTTTAVTITTFASVFETSFDIPSSSSDGLLRVNIAIPPSSLASPPIVICLHGANFASSSFTLLAKYLKEVSIVVAYDARSHGESNSNHKHTQPTNQGEDFSATALTSDCHRVVKAVANWFMSTRKNEDKNKNTCLPPFILVGHSMGAAIATHAAYTWPSSSSSSPSSSEQTTTTLLVSRPPPPPRLGALVIIDLIEGGALASLPHMSAIGKQLQNARFSSIKSCIDWTISSGMLRLRASAELSVPPCLELRDDDKYNNNESSSTQCGYHLKDTQPQAPPLITITSTTSSSPVKSSIYSVSSSSPSSPGCDQQAISSPLKHGSSDTTSNGSICVKSPSSTSSSQHWSWKGGHFLVASEQYWDGWFRGTTRRFLEVGAPRTPTPTPTIHADMTLTTTPTTSSSTPLKSPPSPIPFVHTPLLLLIPTIDRLQADAELAAANMSGKFQLITLPGCGHVMHEDVPDKVALVLRTFLSRNGLTADAEVGLLSSKLAGRQVMMRGGGGNGGGDGR